MLTLTPKVHPKIKRFLKEESFISSLSVAYGSPLNIIFPEIMNENILSFQEVLKKNQIKGKIYYAHKTSKANAFVKQAALTNSNIDVASENELKSALNNGFSGNRIEATGPKNREFLSLAIQHNVVISVDNMSELQDISKIISLLQPAHKVSILLRLTNFTATHTHIINKDSRFGINVSDVEEVLLFLKINKNIDFLGFAFHLDSTNITEKVVAIEQCILLFDRAIQLGFEPKVLNIGGGYKVNYLENETEWNTYITALKQSVIGEHEQLTWHGNTFGMYPEKGKIRGALNIYNYFDTSTGRKYLDELLSSPSKQYKDRSIGSIISDMLIELWIEPGRALLDNCGITIASVSYIKESAQEEILIGLNMKRQDIAFLDQEIFIDPRIIYHNSDKEGEEKGVYFTGNLCLETDLINRRKIFLNRLPQINDLVIFINTAGYFMDFSACTPIMQPIASKIAVLERNNNYQWFADELYNPIINELNN